MPVTEEHVLHHVACHYGLEVRRTPDLGYLARFPGSRASFTLGHTPRRALARLVLALSAMPSHGEA